MGTPGNEGASHDGGCPSGRPSPWPLVAICAGYFMVILDTMVVNVALPALSKGLHTSTSGLQWIVDAYSLVFCALLLSAGALGDRRGAKAVFQVGMAIFAGSSLACGLAPTTGLLIAARCAQGLGAALAVPASLVHGHVEVSEYSTNSLPPVPLIRFHAFQQLVSSHSGNSFPLP